MHFWSNMTSSLGKEALPGLLVPLLISLDMLSFVSIPVIYNLTFDIYQCSKQPFQMLDPILNNSFFRKV